MTAAVARLVIVLLVVAAAPCRADVGVIVLEPIGPLGFFTRVGHAGTYLSNICPDGSPVRMRLCGPGEGGGVVSKYSPFSERENYDWAIMPIEEYLHGFESPDLAPLIGTAKLQRAIEEHAFGPIFSSTLKTANPGTLPTGQWKAALATRFDRSLYIFAVETTPADDAAIVAAYNAAPNKSRFNFFYRNCSDQAKGIFDLIWPEPGAIGNRTSGVTMQTPKGLAEALVDRAVSGSALALRVRRLPQLPGTFSRSKPVLFPMENTYKSLAFAPWWFFGGFREVALGAMFYHQVLAPFSVTQASRDFISAQAAELTVEQHRLRRRQDEVRLALSTAQVHDARWSRLSVVHASVYRRLAEISRQKQFEVDRITGSKARWQELDRRFESMVRAVDWRDVAPSGIARVLARPARQHSGASRQILRHIEEHGEFFVHRGGPWLRLTLADGQVRETGVSLSQIGDGDPRLAAFLLTAVLDHTLHAPAASREDIETVDGLFEAFRQATHALPRREGIHDVN